MQEPKGYFGRIAADSSSLTDGRRGKCFQVSWFLEHTPRALKIGKSYQSMYLRFVFILLPVFTASASMSSLETARSAVKEWAGVEKTISFEAAEWVQKEQLLKDLIEVETQRIDRLAAERDESEAGMGAADEERQVLLEREKSALEMAAKVEEFLIEIETYLHELRVRLPEPLSKGLASAFQRLPEGGDDMGLSLGERMRTVISVMGRIRKFDVGLHVDESIRELPDGGEVSVRTLYVGLGQAYYLAPNDAGYGTPGPTGWVWESAPEFEDAIREALQVLDGDAPEPVFVDLPVNEVAEVEVGQ
jgi:hypothetical protein